MKWIKALKEKFQRWMKDWDDKEEARVKKDSEDIKPFYDDFL